MNAMLKLFIAVNFLTWSVHTFAEPISWACTQLLQSDDERRISAPLDRRQYYSHSVFNKTYSLREETPLVNAKRDVKNFYEFMFAKELKLTGTSTKAAFCSLSSQNLQNIVDNTKADDMDRQTASDCKMFLDDACLEPDSFGGLEKPTIIIPSDRTSLQVQKKVEELFSKEESFADQIRSLVKTSEVIEQIFSEYRVSTFRRTQSSTYKPIQKMMKQLKIISEHVDPVLEQFKGAYRTGSFAVEMVTLALYENFFEKTADAFQKYRQQYAVFTAAAKTEIGQLRGQSKLQNKDDPDNFFGLLSPLLLLPLQQATRYRLHFEDFVQLRDKDSLDALAPYGSLVAVLTQAVEDFAKTVNRD